MSDTVTLTDTHSPSPPRDDLAWTAPFTLVAAFVALVGFSLGFNAPHWTIRAIAMLGFAAVGVVVVFGPVRRRFPTVTALALAYLAIAIVATLASGDIAKAVFGLYGHGAGLLLLAALVGAWALGASLSLPWKQRLESVVLFAAALNGVVAVIQVVWEPPVEGFTLQGERATGLFAAPEHLAALMVAAAVLLAWRRPAGAPGWAALVAAGGGVALSGSVIGAVVVIVLVATLLLRRGGPDFAVAGVVVASYLAASVAFVSLGPVTFEDAGSFGIDTVQGLVTSGKAFASDPVFGTGPGLYRTAATAERTPALAANAAPEAVWLDGHNLIAESAVTLGVLGVILLVAWVAVALRRGRGSWLAVSGVLFVVLLFAPLDPGIALLTFVAMGAAMPSAPSPSRSRRQFAAAALLPVALLGGVLVVGDIRLESGYTDHDIARADAAADLFPMWTEPLDAAARAAMLARITSGSDEAGVVARARYEEAVRNDPTDPASWNRLAEVELILGDVNGAAAHYREALERYPWSVRARLGLAEINLAWGRVSEARRLAEEAQEIVPTGFGSDILARIDAVSGSTG